MRLKMLAIPLIGAFLLSSCSNQTPMGYFTKSDHFEAAMSSLQMGTLLNGFDTEAVIKVIYLNQVFKDEYQKDENFYVSTHIVTEPYDESKRGLHHKLYTFLMNGKKPKLIKELDQDDPLRLEMPITERWSRYYHVVFDEVKENKLNITFTRKHQDTILLKFEKDALDQ